MLEPIAAKFIKANPNTLTIISLILAFLAGFMIYLSIDILLIFASISIFLSGFLDVLDGKVARMRHMESKEGDFLDHVVDRYSDILIIGGIALSRYSNGPIAATALVAVLMASYMGTQSQAVGIGRDYRGILSRADRIAILTFLPLFQFIFLVLNVEMPSVGGYTYSLTDYVMLWFVIAGFWTAIYRGITTWKALKS